MLSLDEPATSFHLDDGATTPDTTTASSQSLFWAPRPTLFKR